MILPRFKLPEAKRRSGILGIMVLLILGPTTAQAQFPQRNTDATRSPSFSTDEDLFGGLEAEEGDDGTTYAPSSPGDEDLGEQVLIGERSYDPFTVSLGIEGIFTSNAGLTDRNEIDDFYTYTELDLRYIPQIGDQTFANLSANYGLYRYSDQSRFDFDSLDLSAGLMRVFPDFHNLVAWVNYEYTRLADGRNTGNSLFSDHSIQLGLYLPVPVAYNQFAFASYLSEFSLEGKPAIARRDEHGLTLGYSYLPTEKLKLSVYYQVFFYDYRRTGRHDIFQDVGVGLEYKVTENFFVGLESSFSANNSNRIGGDYVVGDIGASLNLMARF